VRKYLAIQAFALLAAALLLPACSGDDDDEEPATRSATVEIIDSKFKGVLASPPFPKPEVVLTDTEGEPFDVRADTEGRVLLLYLGYTHCPDICPTHMADIDAVMQDLPPDVTEKLQVVFVTTDPERDTPERVREWLDLFNEDFIGLIPTQDQLDQVLRNLSMQPITKTDLGGGAYAVNHAAYVLAYADDNTAHLVYPLGVTRDVWANDLTLLAREGFSQ
jgi:protein SCO1/2